VLGVVAPEAVAGGKFGAYVLRMVPTGLDAALSEQPGWGGGVHAIVPIPFTHRLTAASIGAEFTRLLDESDTFIDKVTGLPVEREIDQYYIRLYIGLRIGEHGDRTFRPFAGVNLAVIDYGIGIDEVADDPGGGSELRRDVYDKRETALGYDLSVGADAVFSKLIALEGGVRYSRSLSPVADLGWHSIRVAREYIHFYIGLGVMFDLFRKRSSR
jgi:hypothetical protein